MLQAFVGHYYQTFDSNRDALLSLYQDQSKMTWEGQQILGAQNIVNKFKSLPFQKVQHQIGSCDSQPSSSGGILIMVNGKLLVRCLGNLPPLRTALLQNYLQKVLFGRKGQCFCKSAILDAESLWRTAANWW